MNSRYDFYFYQQPIFRYVNCLIRIFYGSVTALYRRRWKKILSSYWSCFLAYSEIYFHSKPSINISAVSPSQNLISYVTILYVQSRDLSRDQLKRLHDQRKANILNNSPLLEACHSFDAGLWLLHEKQNLSLVSMLEWFVVPVYTIFNINIFFKTFFKTLKSVENSLKPFLYKLWSRR